MAYIVDGVVILIFLLSVFIGHKRGFIKTISGVVALAAALAVALLLKAPVAEFVYDTIVEPPLVESYELQMDAIDESITGYYNGLPQVVKNLLAQTGIADSDSFVAAMPAHGPSPVIRPVLVPLMETICSLVLFLLAYIAAKLLLRALDIVAKLPLLKQVNKSLGFVAGALSGVLWVLLAVAVLQVVVTFGGPDSAINMALLDKTVLVNWLVSCNPLSFIPTL